jgi:hypothetical protein
MYGGAEKFTRALVGKQTERDHLEEPRVDRRIILR